MILGFKSEISWRCLGGRIYDIILECIVWLGDGRIVLVMWVIMEG